MAKLKKLTGENIQLFKTRIEYWLNFFNLSEWEHAIIVDDDDVGRFLAYMNANEKAMQVSFFICNKWDEGDITKKNIDETALHEVLELLLWKIGDMAGEMYNFSIVSSEKHKIINRLIKKFL